VLEKKNNECRIVIAVGANGNKPLFHHSSFFFKRLLIMISIANLDFHYDKGDFRLTIPEFTVAQSEKVAVIGPISILDMERKNRPK
jgi:hypothetical protein